MKDSNTVQTPTTHRSGLNDDYYSGKMACKLMVVKNARMVLWDEVGEKQREAVKRFDIQ